MELGLQHAWNLGYQDAACVLDCANVALVSELHGYIHLLGTWYNQLCSSHAYLVYEIQTDYAEELLSSIHLQYTPPREGWRGLSVTKSQIQNNQHPKSDQILDGLF